ncbi:MAG: alpha/beta-type small acid-soluble spore protein [Clostridia bacterium]|nr:alpha/beta-type small acid-soluble spore protein [Clostridia bacterium]
MYNNNQNNAANQNQNSTGNKQGAMVPEAKQALNNLKYEIAGELGINLKQGYNGDLPSRQAGSIGGYMVKRLVEQAERQMAGK